ncbi:MAG: hypothetical protein GX329_05310 [Tissierellia bacterium]|nr:hypothetical protein [Tissierellia bacterium]
MGGDSMNRRKISLALVVIIMVLAFAPMVNASSNRLLRMGSRGSDVRTLQQKLNSLGYNCGSVDGIFGANTLNAVRNFQRRNGLAVDGIVGPATRSKLYGGSTPSRGGGTSSGGSSSSSSSGKAPITGLLRRGSRGSQVSTLQKRLNALGYNAGSADGIFGVLTYNAVVRFQRANKLAVDGIVGPATIAKLYPSGSSSSGSSGSSGSSKPKPPTKPSTPQHKPPVNNVPLSGLIRMGDRGSQVVTLQKRLNALGYNAGSADGIFGTLTYNAVVRFQRAKKLAVDGIVGPATIAALYPPKNDPGLNNFVEYEVKKDSLKGTTVIVDAGHGGKDPGAVRDGHYEKTFTLDLAKRLQRMLKKAGAEVIMTRTGDTDPGLKNRANKVNEKVLDEEIKRVKNDIAKVEEDIRLSGVTVKGLNGEIEGLEGEITVKINELPEEQGFGDLKDMDISENLGEIMNIIEEKLKELKPETSEGDAGEGSEETGTPEDGSNGEPNTESNGEEKPDSEGLLDQLENIEKKLIRLAEFKSLQKDLGEFKSELQTLKGHKADLANLAGKSRKAEINKKFKDVLDRAKEYHNIIFISIHNNSTGANSQTSASGIRVYYRPTMKVETDDNKLVVYYDGYNDDGRELFARTLNTEMQKKSVFSQKTNKLYNDSDLAVLRDQNVASALVEVGFMNNPNDLALLKRQQTREDIAAGMFEGIRNYFVAIKDKLKNLLAS